MKLDESQIEEFDTRGYLFFPNLLDADEVAVLQREVAGNTESRRPRGRPRA